MRMGKPIWAKITALYLPHMPMAITTAAATLDALAFGSESVYGTTAAGVWRAQLAFQQTPATQAHMLAEYSRLAPDYVAHADFQDDLRSVRSAPPALDAHPACRPSTRTQCAILRTHADIAAADSLPCLPELDAGLLLVSGRPAKLMV